MERLLENPSPITWIDDQAYDANVLVGLEGTDPATPVLMVQTSWHIGISRRQWRLISEFIDDWHTYSLVSLDVENDEYGQGHIRL